MRKHILPKTALVLSLLLLVIWGLMGAGSTIAWFADETEELRNSFIIGDVNIAVSYKAKNENGNFKYEPIDEKTHIFDDGALYEPGYTQVVYLKIENTGDVALDYRLSVDITDFTNGINRFGGTIYLPDYLRFGVVTGKNEAEINQTVKDRSIAQDIATTPLNNYSGIGSLSFEAGQNTEYAALIIYMPEYIDNAANYIGNDIPTVKLRLTVAAAQKGALG
ncbi:MAG: hypothetical protein IJ470_04315 [Clostridia bacterium]|nr:hypothetical protein [Clostridia bacterium]